MTNEVVVWLGYVMYVALAISILATIMLGVMMVLDRDRGEPVSATAPYVAALRIALGTMIISSAGSLAAFFA
ncbi:hypothetical protein CMUST_15560 (plasmid) [Corynebacterium mustelae]|uniref:Uncharacterized protein n=1 Tax=Corynebacterium mustelae TaxID=571915 RepID=A0A0G3H1W3_9CORY|nr:hypothetical protein CMUST_15560 [Corynebacterium mustelae]